MRIRPVCTVTAAPAQGKSLPNVFLLQFRVFAPQFLAVGIQGHQFHHASNCRTETAHARLSVHLAGVACDAVQIHGLSFSGRGRLQGQAMPIHLHCHDRSSRNPATRVARRYCTVQAGLAAIEGSESSRIAFFTFGRVDLLQLKRHPWLLRLFSLLVTWENIRMSTQLNPFGLAVCLVNRGLTVSPLPPPPPRRRPNRGWG